jgi:hypothetical protein
MGATTLAAPAPSLHRAWWWLNAFAKMEALQIPEKYLFPKRALSMVFRAKYMAALRKLTHVPQHIARKAFQKKWVVFAKQPFASPKTVVEYLGRYSHKLPSQTTGLFR